MKIYILEAVKNIKRNMTLAFLLILFIVFFLVFTAFVVRTVDFQSKNITLSRTEAFVQYLHYNLNFTANCKYNMDDTNDNPFLFYEIPKDEAVRNRAVANYDEIMDIFNKLEAMQSEDFIFIYIGSSGTKIANLKNKDVLFAQEYTDFRVRQKKSLEELAKTNDEIRLEGFDDAWEVKTLRVNDSFFKYENLHFIEGGNLTEENLAFEYLSTEEKPIVEVPVIVGYNFKDYYKVGDILETWSDTYRENAYLRDTKDKQQDYYDQLYCVYRIVGILEKGTVVSNFAGSMFISLDNYIVSPYKLITSSNYFDFTDNQKIESLNLLIYDILQHKIYIPRDKEGETIAKIYDILKGTCLDGVLFPVCWDYINELTASIYEERVNSYLFISIAVGIFFVVGISFVLVSKFKENLRDYGIHRLIGATGGDIVACGITEMLLYIAVSNILMFFPLVLAFFGISTPFGETYALWGNPNLLSAILFVDILLLVISILCTYICYRKYPFVELIKGKE